MSCVWDDLVPFLRFAQFVGFFPFRIQKNGFHFSWRRLSFVWFVLVLLFQVAPLAKIITDHQDVKSKEFSASKLPLIFKLPMFRNLVTHYGMILIIRSATLRYHQLNLAFKYLTCDALRELEDMVTAGYKNAITKKTRIGICLILITVCTSNINN